MRAIPAQEIKRRGLVAVDPWLEHGPVHVIKNNRPRYVVMSEAEYDSLMSDLAHARLAASETDLKAGRTRRGTASDLMKEIKKGR